MNLNTIVASVFVFGLLLNCGPLRAADDPAANLDDLAKDKLLLAELEKEVTAKKKELANLEAQIDVLRKLVLGAEAANDGVHQSAPKIFAKMPKDAYPRGGSDGGIERSKAWKWCEDNVVGREVQWTATVKKVSISSKEPFNVTVDFEQPWRGSKNGGSAAFAMGDWFKLGDQLCQVVLQPYLSHDLTQRYVGCPADDADKIRKLKGKTVTLRAKVMRVEDVFNADRHEEERVSFHLVVYVPSLDGFLPQRVDVKPKVEPAPAEK